MAGPLPVNESTDQNYPPLKKVKSNHDSCVTGATNEVTDGIVNGILDIEHSSIFRHSYVPKDTPLENFRKLKVIIVGAGYSGIYYGIRIPERLRNVDLQIYEKNEDVGGTWWENRYPGW